MSRGSTKAIEAGTSAIAIIRRCRRSVLDILAGLNLVIARRLAMAGLLREAIEHLELALDLHGSDQQAEIQRAITTLHTLLEHEIAGTDITPALELRSRFLEHDASMTGFIDNLGSILTGLSPQEVCAHIHAPRKRSRFRRILHKLVFPS